MPEAFAAVVVSHIAAALAAAGVVVAASGLGRIGLPAAAGVVVHIEPQAVVAAVGTAVAAVGTVEVVVGTVEVVVGAHASGGAEAVAATSSLGGHPAAEPPSTDCWGTSRTFPFAALLLPSPE